MVRVILAVCVSLLLAMQQETVVHAFRHDGARLADTRDTTVHKSSAEGSCAFCVLLFGTHAAASLPTAFAPVVAPAWQAVTHPAWAAPAVPRYYRSRAPPLPL